MPVNIQDVMDILSQILQERNLRVCLESSLKGGAITGLSALCGGILLGPVGLAIGGIVGGLGTAVSAKNSFESAAVVLRKLPEAKKKILYSKIQHAFRDFGVQDVAMIASLMLSNHELQSLAFRVAKDFFQSEMYMTVKQN